MSIDEPREIRKRQKAKGKHSEKMQKEAPLEISP